MDDGWWLKRRQLDGRLQAHTSLFPSAAIAGFDANLLVQARTHMSLRAIETAPLIIGTDLTKASPAILDVLRAPEMIAVDQDAVGSQGVLAYTVKTLANRRWRCSIARQYPLP